MKKYDIMNMPNAEYGKCKIGEFDISEKDVSITNLRLVFTPGMGNRVIYPGRYKYLKINGTTVMSNTHAEISDHSYFVYNAKGSVLVNGLGLGVVLCDLLNKPDVIEVTVIEKEEDVIRLVSPFFKDEKRLTIIHADALTWKLPKGKRYDCVWHDIWPSICGDNLVGMKLLHRRYGRRTRYQESWCRSICEMHR